MYVRPNGYIIVNYYHWDIYFAKKLEKKIRAAGSFNFIVEEGYLKKFAYIMLVN